MKTIIYATLENSDRNHQFILCVFQEVNSQQKHNSCLFLKSHCYLLHFYNIKNNIYMVSKIVLYSLSSLESGIISYTLFFWKIGLIKFIHS